MNREVADPSLKDVLDLLKKDIFLSLNCHHVGIIESFDEVNQTVRATVAYKKKFLERQKNGTYKELPREYPILVDVPVIFLGGGGFSLTFPIAKGDECLLLFNDRSIDDWFSKGQVSTVSSPRLHSFSDGFALVGIRSLNKVIQDFDTDAGVIRKGDFRIGIKDKVLLKSDVETLNDIMGDFIDQLVGLTTTNAVVGAPCTLSPASITALNGIKTRLAAMLE